MFIKRGWERGDSIKVRNEPPKSHRTNFAEVLTRPQGLQGVRGCGHRKGQNVGVCTPQRRKSGKLRRSLRTRRHVRGCPSPRSFLRLVRTTHSPSIITCRVAFVVNCETGQRSNV
ncbi:hypothetical protein JTB14_009836 [Gonioctena quinquepunctata]|nr:hypothetical protein JTB14_009836 [Gonioctena quinquepunctata]